MLGRSSGLMHVHSGVAGLQCGPDKVEWRVVRAARAEAALKGNALSVDTLVTAMEELQHDIDPGNTPGVPHPGMPPRTLAAGPSTFLWHDSLSAFVERMVQGGAIAALKSRPRMQRCRLLPRSSQGTQHAAQIPVSAVLCAGPEQKWAGKMQRAMQACTW